MITVPRVGTHGRQAVAEGCLLCLQPSTLRRTIPIALVVGSLLTLINEGDLLLAGDVSARTAVKIVLNFCVPFVVSSLGFATGSRARAEPRHR